MEHLTTLQRLGLNFPPVLLRAMLGVIFLWAGLGKVSQRFEPSKDEAVLLSTLGVMPAPAATPAATTPVAPTTGDAKDAKTGDTKATEPAAAAPVRVLAVNRLAILIARSASPQASGDKPAPMPLWPQALGTGPWPVRMAWAAAITELVGGFCLLLGLFTRVWGLALAGVMLVAIWLTEIGPAIQSGNTVLGFLPNYDAFSPQAWQRLMFQGCCLVMALSLAALGSGRLGLDHIVLRRGRAEDED